MTKNEIIRKPYLFMNLLDVLLQVALKRCREATILAQVRLLFAVHSLYVSVDGAPLRRRELALGTREGLQLSVDEFDVLYEMVLSLRHVVALWALDGPGPLVFPPEVRLVLGFILGLEAADHALGLLLVLVLAAHVLVVAILAIERPVALRALERLQLGVRR